MIDSGSGSRSKDFTTNEPPCTLVSAPQLNIGSYAIMIGRIIFQSSVVKVETKYLMQFFIIIISGLSQPRLNPSHINFIRYLLELIHILQGQFVSFFCTDSIYRNAYLLTYRMKIYTELKIWTSGSNWSNSPN